jgi:aminoglycoside 3-N-acetyltransferase
MSTKIETSVSPRPPATRASLRGDLDRLGVRPGDLIMVHASIRSIGPVVGGVNVVIEALFDTVGADGTVTAYVDFEPWYAEDDDPASIPVFDKRIAHAARDHGVLHEALRNWPGAVRSDHPDAGVVAIGPRAEWITAPHPFHYGYGEGSPFERIVQGGGRVLMLGAPLDSITLLHHAEHRAKIPDKRIRRYRRLMPGPGGPTWVAFEEFDTGDPVNDRLPADYFSRIARDHLAAGHGREGLVGRAESFLFEAALLVPFGVDWLERFLASPPDRSDSAS